MTRDQLIKLIDGIFEQLKVRNESLDRAVEEGIVLGIVLCDTGFHNDDGSKIDGTLIMNLISERLNVTKRKRKINNLL